MASSPTIAACLIARNGAATLERCLASLRSHVDEVCVFLAGGSTDGTPELLVRLSAERGASIIVEQGAWHDDYAKARNGSFAMASSDYLAWFDDDEVLEGGEHLRPLLHNEPDLVYVRRVDVWAWDAIGPVTMRLRAVRASLGLRWRSPVHEHLEPLPEGCRAALGEPAEIRVVHHPLLASDRHSHRERVERLHAAAPSILSGHYLGRHLLLDDRDPAAAATVLEWVVEQRPERHEIAMIASSWGHLARCRGLLGDVTGMVAARERERATLARLWLVDLTFARGCRIEEANPITDDDPVWERYASDPRTLHPRPVAATA